MLVDQPRCAIGSFKRLAAASGRLPSESHIETYFHCGEQAMLGWNRIDTVSW